MVSLWSGELNRTWRFVDPEGGDKEHVVTLYHDTITGVRCAMMDYEEIQGSMGTSSVLMSSSGVNIPFIAGGRHIGRIHIAKDGLLGFRYECWVGNTRLVETLQQSQMPPQPPQQSMEGMGVGFGGPPAGAVVQRAGTEAQYQYRIEIPGTQGARTTGGSRCVWYLVHVRRLPAAYNRAVAASSAGEGSFTIVHRRFRDFARFDAEMQAALKGNHLCSSLPPLPEKHVKLLLDHEDPEFVEQRRSELEDYLRRLLNMPFVTGMYQVHSFLGIARQLREFSIVVESQSLGLTVAEVRNDWSPSGATVAPSTNRERSFRVTEIQSPDLRQVVREGDILSKVNGHPVGPLSFPELMRQLSSLPRPFVMHFLQKLAPEINKDEDAVEDLQFGSAEAVEGIPVRGLDVIEQPISDQAVNNQNIFEPSFNGQTLGDNVDPSAQPQESTAVSGEWVT